MKRIIPAVLFVGVVVVVFFVTISPLTTDVDLVGLVGLSTITPTVPTPTPTPTPANTSTPKATFTPAPTLTPTAEPIFVFDPRDQEYFRDYIRGAGVDDCIGIDNYKIWDNCFEPNGMEYWPYHIIAYDPEDYMRNFKSVGPRSSEGWIFGPVDQDWPLQYSGEISIQKLTAVFACATTSQASVSDLWKDPVRSAKIVAERDLRVLALIPITEANMNKLIMYSPLLYRYPSYNYSSEIAKECGDLISLHIP